MNSTHQGVTVTVQTWHITWSVWPYNLDTSWGHYDMRPWHITWSPWPYDLETSRGHCDLTTLTQHEVTDLTTLTQHGVTVTLWLWHIKGSLWHCDLDTSRGHCDLTTLTHQGVTVTLWTWHITGSLWPCHLDTPSGHCDLTTLTHQGVTVTLRFWHIKGHCDLMTWHINRSQYTLHLLCSPYSTAQLSLAHADIAAAIRQRYMRSTVTMEQEASLHRVLAGRTIIVPVHSSQVSRQPSYGPLIWAPPYPFTTFCHWNLQGFYDVPQLKCKLVRISVLYFCRVLQATSWRQRWWFLAGTKCPSIQWTSIPHCKFSLSCWFLLFCRLSHLVWPNNVRSLSFICTFKFCHLLNFKSFWLEG